MAHLIGRSPSMEEQLQTALAEVRRLTRELEEASRHEHDHEVHYGAHGVPSMVKCVDWECGDTWLLWRWRGSPACGAEDKTASGGARCSMPPGHPGDGHAEIRDGELWASWRGPHP